MAQNGFRCIACESDGAPEVLANDGFAWGAGEARGTWEFRLLRCRGCGLGRLDPPPDDATLRALYSADYCAYDGEAGQRATATPSRKVKMLISEVAAFAGRDGGAAPAALRRGAAVVTAALEFAGARTVPFTTSEPFERGRDARTLDFGCGWGWWLRSMAAQGFRDLWGYDIDQPGLPKLERAGIQVARSFADLPKEAFDVIRLEHVLEHIVDPVATLRQLGERLRPDGAIVIAVPNFGCWAARTAGLSWGNMALPHHLSHFTEAALRAVASQARLRVDEVQFLPIWEAAATAVDADGKKGRPRTAPDFRSLGPRLWKHRYHAWSRRQHDGDVIGLRLVR
ncbi:MAG: class I SAM-dependent methyltransferase [Pseudomonadota bacterium]|nr:class I SAM-dependent methyltransferase [Pseudomonadota bacterium]